MASGQSSSTREILVMKRMRCWRALGHGNSPPSKLTRVWGVGTHRAHLGEELWPNGVKRADPHTHTSPPAGRELHFQGSMSFWATRHTLLTHSCPSGRHSHWTPPKME